MAFVFFCNIALFIILFAITRLAGKRGGVSILSFIVLLVLNLLLLLSIELLFRISTEYTIATDETVIVNSCLFLASIVSLALYEIMSWSASRRQEAETKLRVLQQVQEDLIIIVRNDYLPSSVRIEGGRYISSKTNKAMHGYGLENVESICEAADGSCYIKRDDSRFSVRIILPY
ncbi:MAG: GHKL domain-containing protein [Firmicutes bacterium]|nr:GHKL domain-containing protein [Bacillota bacterium]